MAGEGAPAGARETTLEPPLLSFDRVFREHAGYVYGLLRRLGVREADADDVAQEIFLVVHRRLPAFEGRSSLKTWLCGIAMRVVYNYRRKAHRRREVAHAEPPQDSAPPVAVTRIERMQDTELLRSLIEKLPSPRREIFVLFEIEELSMAEVARVVGCPRFTAYTRLYAARRQIREGFERARRDEAEKGEST